MSRRTNIGILSDILNDSPKQQLSINRLAEELGWSIAKVDAVVTKAERNSAARVFRGQGGVIRYRGSENRGPETGIYHDVARIIRDYWGNDAGLKEIEIRNTAQHGHRGRGRWTHPDLAMSALPPRRQSRDDPPDFHSIEVETSRGFDISSVYQAHSHGRGANFSWVFFEMLDNNLPNFDRVEWAAVELGIGLVRFTNSASSKTYRTLTKAVRKFPRHEERTVFANNSGLVNTSF